MKILILANNDSGVFKFRKEIIKEVTPSIMNVLESGTTIEIGSRVGDKRIKKY